MVAGRGMKVLPENKGLLPLVLYEGTAVSPGCKRLKPLVLCGRCGISQFCQKRGSEQVYRTRGFSPLFCMKE